jgi:DNA helicase-2/ATP-dependent DNA helicase PcrA
VKKKGTHLPYSLSSSQGIRAGKILALNLYHKAAGEMKERIAGIAGPEIVRFLWMGTFHSNCKDLIIEGVQVGIQTEFYDL